MNLKLYCPSSWTDYELIDSGDGEKLERFGKFTLIRPEPQAIWSKVMDDQEWKRLADNRFDREQKDKYRFVDDVNGGWGKNSKVPENWNVNYQYNDLKITLRLGLTSFGHVGVFPEQGNNWNFIYDSITSWKAEKPRVLNLFAYTGAASIVAKAAGADVTHVDASRPGLNWANHNMQLNDLKDIRWVYEDALKFVKREVKRGNTYNGIIMDPPPYGRGPDGEKWTLQEKLNELIQQASQLLEKKNSFFILSMYAVGLSPIVGLNVVKSHFKAEPECGEFFLKSRTGLDLPMGTFLRFRL
ncbi:MAG TPA: class I SAM-dependent methyltransferase [Cyclobacteriaceae bacterium]|nr:class I SAM-dependent methyltransferase [Cyclobacteriaceae bacterium]